jgi:phosphotriesterase-related protein
MSAIQTVTGPIDADRLGVTLIHEHLRFRDEAVAAQWPDRYDERAELQAAVAAVNAARERGVRTIVDPTAMFGGRDVAFMRSVAEETGVQVVPCTGIYSYDHLPPYFANRDIDEMAEHFVADIEAGIQGTEIRAAFIKCAADAAGITPNVEKIHRAAARASLRTGAPIMAHSMPAVGTGPLQVEIFKQEGVPLGRVQIAHCGDSADLDYITGLLAEGVYAGLDRYGLEVFLPIEKRNEVAAALLRAGYRSQLFLGQDFCASIDWFAPAAAQMMIDQGAVRNWSMTLVFDEVLPALRSEGVLDEETFGELFIANPRRWLAG